ncbi:flagellar hook assembly protein FlgD [Pigmentibacter ruber]|uniref:flagellar hook assembly protein FlgD n=1 Tax=Pigmentibacter ruber TaxID=2683196 RepID=UPI00131A7986|nr:flagellar hook capping FlgD N-terminal domain-containing protein [Pigmentibacter ruber]BFD31688.1 hypothetical protein GTC16762_13060 [Pigmentibacter ruber]
MYIGESRGVAKIPEKAPEPPKSVGLKMEKGDDAPNFENMIYESNLARQAEIEKEKNEAGGDFRLGETKNDREFRKQLEKVTGKKQDLAKNKLERDDYLNLLVTQLKYQDPSKPMEHYEMASQMAQFNTVEQLMGVNKVLTEMKKMQNDAKAEKLSQYLGKDIEIQGNSIKLSGDGKANLAKFELPAGASNVIAEIRDEHSKVVKSIPMGALQPGVNKINWDGTNDKGVKQPNGIYTFNILASSEDGKPMTAKTSYIAKVEGITDILSGGKLDTDVGIADPAKIIAIRNPEPTTAPVQTKPQKNQLISNAQLKEPGKNSQEINEHPGQINAALKPDDDKFDASASKNIDEFKANHLNSLTQGNENKVFESDFAGSKNKAFENDNGIGKNKAVPAKTNPNDVFSEPKLNLTEYKNQNKVTESKEASTRTGNVSSPPKQRAVENYQEPKAAPKYGGAPTVNGINGRT